MLSSRTCTRRPFLAVKSARSGFRRGSPPSRCCRRRAVPRTCRGGRQGGTSGRRKEKREREAHLVKVVLVPARLLQVHLEHLVPGVGRSLRATDPHPACRQGASAREPDRASARGRAGRTGVEVVPAVVLLRDEVVRRHERLHVRVRVVTKGDVRVDEEEVAVREDLDEGCEGCRRSQRGDEERVRESSLTTHLRVWARSRRCRR